MSEVGKGVRLTKASGEWEVAGEKTGASSLGDMGAGRHDHSPGIIYEGPERAIPSRGFAPIVPNDAWEPDDLAPPYWCVRPGGVWPRVHRPEHFLLFDPGLSAYRRCPRCGATIYTGMGRG